MSGTAEKHGCALICVAVVLSLIAGRSIAYVETLFQKNPMEKYRKLESEERELQTRLLTRTFNNLGEDVGEYEKKRLGEIHVELHNELRSIMSIKRENPFLSNDLVLPSYQSGLEKNRQLLSEFHLKAIEARLRIVEDKVGVNDEKTRQLRKFVDVFILFSDREIAL